MGVELWPRIQDALERVFSGACSIPFVWEDEPRKMLKRPFGVLSLGASTPIGRDFAAYTFRDSDISLDISGYRELVVGVQVFSRRAHGEHSSRALLEKARLSLANPIVRDELRYAGLVFVENHPLVNLDFSFQNRKESRASFDITFRLVLQESTPFIGKYFDSIQMESEL